MARAFNFDTLAYANRLKQAGVPDKQAEMKTDIIKWVVGLFVAQSALIWFHS